MKQIFRSVKDQMFHSTLLCQSWMELPEIYQNLPDSYYQLPESYPVALVRPIIEYCVPLWAPNRESHKLKLEGVQRSFTRYCFPSPWHSIPSYNTRLQTLDIPTTIFRFDYLHTMFVVGFLWGKYDISWEDYVKVNTSNSRQAVNIDFRHLRSRTDAFHNSLFVSFPRIWSTLPDDVSSEIVFNLFSFSCMLCWCVYIYLKCFFFLFSVIFIVSAWFSETF